LSADALHKVAAQVEARDRVGGAILSWGEYSAGRNGIHREGLLLGGLCPPDPPEFTALAVSARAGNLESFRVRAYLIHCRLEDRSTLESEPSASPARRCKGASLSRTLARSKARGPLFLPNGKSAALCISPALAETAKAVNSGGLGAKPPGEGTLPTHPFTAPEA
jgi:hypothetical protein